MIEWYKVYESRLAINLLEPWEKCLANMLVVSMVAVLLYVLTMFVELISSLT